MLLETMNKSELNLTTKDFSEQEFNNIVHEHWLVNRRVVDRVKVTDRQFEKVKSWYSYNNGYETDLGTVRFEVVDA